jgi:hypothetical protein
LGSALRSLSIMQVFVKLKLGLATVTDNNHFETLERQQNANKSRMQLPNEILSCSLSKRTRIDRRRLSS